MSDAITRYERRHAKEEAIKNVLALAKKATDAHASLRAWEFYFAKNNKPLCQDDHEYMAAKRANVARADEDLAAARRALNRICRRDIASRLGI